ncbi:MAG: ABC transporter permease [Acidobacteria bacterium]|nr:ABC transporter permease [Acidobacteriota bacterium]
MRDNLRDRRALMSSLVYPLLGPALLALIFMVVGKSVSERSEKPLELPVAGVEHAPNLVTFLEQNGAEVVPAPEDPEAAVKSGDAEVVLVIPAGFGEDFQAGRPAAVRLVVDDSRQSAGVSIGRAEALLRTYSAQIGALRLMARGVSPQVMQAVAVERVNLATPQSQAAAVLSMTPYFIVLALFIGGMYLAIDSTAGERERGSLEPLLINPASRRQVVFGKYAATLVFTVVGLAVTLIGLMVLMNLFPLENYLGIRFHLSGTALVAIFFIALTIALLAASLQILIATFTRSFKEAQTYLSLLPLVPALPGIFLALLPVKTHLWMMLIPTFGQQLLINHLMRGESVSALHVAVASGRTAAAGLALITLAAKLYERERVIFGR